MKGLAELKDKDKITSMKNIVIIHLTPLIPRLRDAFMIDAFLGAGYNVEYWDLTSIYRPSVVMPDELHEPYVVKINNYSDFKLMVDKVLTVNPIFLLSFDYSKKFDKLFSILIANKCYLSRINIYPSYFSRMKFDTNLLKFVFDLSFLKSIMSDLKGIFFSLVSFGDNAKVFDSYFSCSPPRTHVINNPNFEIFKNLIDEERRLMPNDYILFVDSFFPMHPECSYFSKNYKKHAIQYYRRMRHFFDWLESNFKLPVIIAAHPSSTYKHNEFGPRQIVFGETALLTKDAEIVIQHGSFSHIFTILFDKPLVFIKTSQMKYYQGMFASYKIAYLAGLFGKKAYNIDKVHYNQINFTKVNKNLRENYIYSQITTKETEHLTNREILITEFEKIFIRLKKTIVEVES